MTRRMSEITRYLCHSTSGLGTRCNTKLIPTSLPVSINYHSRLSRFLKPPCTQGPDAGQTFYTTDPGKALISGQCSDISRTKGPILRGLSARAPYFHNGAAANLSQVVNFYNERFQIGLTAQEMQDLINFLQTL